MTQEDYEADEARRAMLHAVADRVCTAREHPVGDREYFTLTNGHGRELAAGSLEALRGAARLLDVEWRYTWRWIPEAGVIASARIPRGFVTSAVQ